MFTYLVTLLLSSRFVAFDFSYHLYSVLFLASVCVYKASLADWLVRETLGVISRSQIESETSPEFSNSKVYSTFYCTS